MNDIYHGCGTDSLRLFPDETSSLLPRYVLIKSILSSFSVIRRLCRIGPSSGRGLFAGRWSVSSKISSMVGLGHGVMTFILASSMLLKSILLKVVFTCIKLMLMVLVFQSIFGLYCFSHRSPKIIFSFPSPVARNLVLIFFFLICILSHV